MSTTVNPVHEAEARAFLEEILKTKITGDLNEALKSGVILCNFINTLKPGSVEKVSTSKMPFPQMENIGNYIKACAKLGLPSHYNFMTVDLWENKNMAQVILNINSLKRQLGYGFEKSAPPPEMKVKVIDDQTTSSPAPAVLPVSPRHVGGGAMEAGIETVSLEQGAKTCCSCNAPITSGAVAACGRNYHVKCFVCKRCGIVKLSTAKYYEHNKQPYCEKCIHIINPQTRITAQASNKGFQF